MTPEKVQAVIAWANVPVQRYGTPDPNQPMLSASSTRQHLIRWLVWNDGNGEYTDDDSLAAGHEPLTLAQCWEIVESIHDRETANA
jgi:hypothetical protein